MYIKDFQVTEEYSYLVRDDYCYLIVYKNNLYYNANEFLYVLNKSFIHAVDVNKLYIDMVHIKCIDISTISILIQFVRRALLNEKHVYFVNVSKDIYTMFKMVNLHNFFDII